MKAFIEHRATGYPIYTVIYTEPVQPVNEGWFPEPVIGRLCNNQVLMARSVFACTMTNVWELIL